MAMERLDQQIQELEQLVGTTTLYAAEGQFEDASDDGGDGTQVIIKELL